MATKILQSVSQYVMEWAWFWVAMVIIGSLLYTQVYLPAQEQDETNSTGIHIVENWGDNFTDICYVGKIQLGHDDGFDLLESGKQFTNMSDAHADISRIVKLINRNETTYLSGYVLEIKCD